MLQIKTNAWRFFILSCALVVSVPSLAQFGFGRRGNDQRLEVVDMFDDDGDGILNTAERRSARAVLGSGRNNGGFGRRRGSAGSEGLALSPADVESLPDMPLYDTSAIRTVFLEFEDEDWENEMATFYNTDVEIPVRATVDGVVYEDVGARFRGNSSFRQIPTGLKRPIRLKFDLVNEDQNLYGYRTLNLLNGNNDPSFIRSILYSKIASNYLPIPQVGIFRLVINGENWGIYPHQQQFNSDFVDEFFSEEGGVRWKVPGNPRARGGMEYWGVDDMQIYRRVFEIDNRDREESWQALVHLFQVLNETPLEDLQEELDPILNIDGVLRFLALEVALDNSDGYWTRASDYYIFLDERDGRFHVLPHDFNEVMAAEEGGWGGVANPVTLDPLVSVNDWTKPLRSRLLSVPELQQRYLAYVRDIAQNWMDWDVIGPVATQLHELIAEDVRQDTHKLYSYTAFERSLAQLESFLEQRRRYLLSVTQPEEP